MPTPVSGNKTWVGGTDAEHVVADSNGNDVLGIELERKIPSQTIWKAVTEDDAGRTLKVVWSKDNGKDKYTFVAIDGQSQVDPVLDEADDKGNEYEYRIKEITEHLEQGVQEVFESER